MRFQKHLIHSILSIVLIMTPTFSTLFGQEKSGNRKAAVAGQFYPGTELALRAKLSECYANVNLTYNHDQIQAMLVPHAGYDFSGAIAAQGYGQLASLSGYDNIFILASSHQVSLGMASVYTAGDYETPLGVVKVNTAIARELCEHDLIDFIPEAHLKEHSIEVQLPFLQYFENMPPIVPIVLASQSPKLASELATALKPWFNSHNLFIISADFSHYPAYDEARRIDSLTAEAFCSGQPDTFLAVLGANERSKVKGLATSMCAWPAALTLLYLQNNHAGTYFEKIAYANSGDIQPWGDRKRVVGYHAIILRNNDRPDGFYLSQAHQNQLLKLARETLKNFVYKTGLTPDIPIIGMQAGAFVTLKIDGQLRGCLGNFEPKQDLGQLISELTKSSASTDTRFLPVRSDEVNDIEIEISVLTPLQRIKSADQIVLGKHGIYVKKGNQTGTFLPQVATETGWTLDEFLGHCARDKAGLAWDEWKTAELSTYEAIVFKEKK